ncbi:aspartic proteinase 36 isoform X4 [Fagus crenata]
MRPFIPFIFVLAVVVVPVVYCVLLPLERAFPLTHHGLQLDQLRARDRARHARLLQGSVSGGVVDFPLQGSSDPYVAGLYYTKVKLGSPPKEFNVQIDTGSDILWVTCNSCSDCPQSSALGIQLNFFDSASSSSAALVNCSDPMCTSAATVCSSQSNQCSYSFQFKDGSGTSGYYVSDAMYLDMILGQSLIANSSATIVFG